MFLPLHKPDWSHLLNGSCWLQEKRRIENGSWWYWRWGSVRKWEGVKDLTPIYSNPWQMFYVQAELKMLSEPVVYGYVPHISLSIIVSCLFVSPKLSTQTQVYLCCTKQPCPGEKNPFHQSNLFFFCFSVFLVLFQSYMCQYHLNYYRIWTLLQTSCVRITRHLI